MQRRIILTVLLSVCFGIASSQPQVQSTVDRDFYAGVQANQLLKQILNLSNNNTPVNNPYLFTFSMNSAITGWGPHIGIGYSYHKIKDLTSPSNIESSINDLFYRIGYGRKVMFGKKFQAGYSLDFAGEYLIDKTTTVVVNVGIDSTVSSTKSKTTSFGLGPQASLGYFITDRIILSTEVSYYYFQSKEKQNTENRSYNLFNSTETYSNSNFETESADFSFSLPVALFLTLKF